MPQILIKEKDYTTPGSNEYANYSVAIPGFVSANYSADAFDSNGIYECSSQSDFVANVGKVAVRECGAIAPTTIISGKDQKQIDLSDLVDETVGESTVVKFVDGALKYNLYTATKTSTKKAGKLDDGTYTYVKVTSSKTALTKETYFATDVEYYEQDTEHAGAYIKTTDTAPVDGKTYYIVKESAFAVATLPERTTTKYAVLSAEGADCDDEGCCHHASYGNQMAYELLGLGYTVLYINLGVDTADTSKDDRAAALSRLGKADLWEPLKDKSNYDFRFIVTGLINDVVGANTQIAAIAKAPDKSDIMTFNQEEYGRGDCIAVMDIDESSYITPTTQTAVINAIIDSANSMSYADKYCTICCPTVCYNSATMKNDTEYNKNNKFPASFNYLACFMYALDNNYQEWFATAGYVRGVSTYTIESTSIKIGEIGINALEPRYKRKYKNGNALERSVNVIANIRGIYYLWGNRTAHKLGTLNASDGNLVASHFLNIRQLCTTLKKQIYVACRRYTFDPNSDVLWINFKNAIIPTLENMKANQGIRDYEIIRVSTTMKALLCARVRIVPIEAVEDFDIEISLEDSLGDTSLTVSE